MGDIATCDGRCVTVEGGHLPCSALSGLSCAEAHIVRQFLGCIVRSADVHQRCRELVRVDEGGAPLEPLLLERRAGGLVVEAEARRQQQCHGSEARETT